MNLSEPFIRRPITTTLLMVSLLLFGIMGYRALPVSDLPNVDFPTIQVTASMPGASPETMAASIASPLEKQFSSIAGVDSMVSANSLGQTRITIQFALDRDIDAAAQDVQAAIGKASRQLPAELPQPPSYQKVNPADQPIFYLGLSSQTLPTYRLNEYAETLIAQRLSMISGVASVAVYGSQKKAVRVQLDPKALASREIGIDEAVRSISQANVNLPTGVLQGQHTAMNVMASGQIQEAQDFAPVIVAWRGGAPVRLSEVGRVVDGVERDKIAAWLSGERAIILAVQRQPGTNTVEVVDQIKEVLPGLEKQLPEAVKLTTIYDRSISIRESVDDVKFSLVLTIGLVVMVIFVFLRSVRATVIPSLALPMCVVGTFALMLPMGHSIDNLSLMALTLAVGLVVDDAIVMLENIIRHVEMGKPVMKAALDGSREIVFTIVSMTVSLAAVFLPIVFMGGIVGRLFREFSLVLVVSILLSGVVSLTLTPMLCARFLKGGHGESHGKFFRATEAVFAGMLNLYDWTLRKALKFHYVTFALSLVLAWGAYHLFTTMPKGFLPSEDTGQIAIFTEAEQSVSFEAMTRRQKALHEVIDAEPAVRNYISTVGAGGPNVSGNSGRLFLRLVPREHRAESVDEMIKRLRPLLSNVPGLQAFLQNPPLISLGGRQTKALYQYVLQNPDTDELYRFAAEFEKKMRGLPGLQDVNSDLQIKNPELRLDIKRDKAAALGVSVRQIEEALQSAFSSRQVSTIYAPTNDYQVIVELLPEYQRDPAALSMLYVRSTEGRLVPLDALAEMSQAVGPLSVNHSGQLPAVTVSFNLRPGVALGEAVAQVESLARTDLPPTFIGGFQGQAQAFQSSFKNLPLLLLMAVAVIYIVLGILYESFIHPLTILSGLPSAGFGALATLYLFNLDLNLYAFIGLILLVGIVKKNAIMMIDFALEAQRDQQLSPREAIYQGCLVRFRPIMMTTMAALFGALPIAIGIGAGAESRRPLGLAVVGGLIVSQAVTLYITPVYYAYMDAASSWIRGKLSRREAPVSES